MGRVGDHFVSAQLGLSSRFPESTTSTSADAVPGESASPTALIGGATGQRAPLTEESSSTPAAAVPGGRVSFAGLAEGTSGQSAPTAGIGVSDGGGYLSRGVDGAGEAGTGGADAAGAGAGISLLPEEYWDVPPHDPRAVIGLVYRVARSKAAEVLRSRVVNTSAGGSDLLGGVDRAEVPDMKDGTAVHKTNTAPIPDPMPPALNELRGNFL